MPLVRESAITMPSPSKAKAAGAPTVDRAAVTALATLLRAAALPGENDGFSDAECEAAARFVAETAAARAAGAPAIAIETMPGNERGHLMRIAIVNDDMPFLVDSIAVTLEAAGLAIDRVIHPVAWVSRGADGALTTISAREGSGAARESLIYVEAERGDARERRALHSAIDHALRDVRLAVKDWLKMQVALQEDAQRVADNEGAALLRWMLDRNFTQLGHEIRHRDGGVDAPLGICRGDPEPLIAEKTRDAAIAWFENGGRVPLIIKSNRLSNVHRRVLIDLFILPVHTDGKVVSLSIHAGLWTSAALSTPPEKVPVLRTALAEMMAKFGFDPSGHAGKALVHVLTQLPHDLLVAADPVQLERLVLTAMSLADRPRPKVELLLSPLDRHIFAFIWLPRDAVSTQLRLAVEDALVASSNAAVLGWSLVLEDGAAALLRYTLDLREGRVPDADALDAEVAAMVRGWEPAIEAALADHIDASRAAALAHRYANAFPTAYRLGNPAREAAADILVLRDLGPAMPRSVRLLSDDPDGPANIRLKLYNADGALPLSRAVPALENFGFTVLEEVPVSLGGAESAHIHDFALEAAITLPPPGDPAIAVVEGAIAAVLRGEAENDRFNQLVLAAGVEPEAVGWLRAWFRYLRQTGMSYGIPTVVQALHNAREVTQALIALFRALHDPARADAKAADAARAAIDAGLAQVAAIDEDRILRLIRAVIEATLRTNAFTPAAAEALAFKIDSAAVPGLPKPLPWREIFVYSPRVEGIHLRAGPVARGGLRWSDRRDDFRTEILGLMKAQRVKNAVIVPTGAKGGFYPKALPDPAADRDAWLAEGTECYRIFIRTLLSITDNLSGSKVVSPKQVVRRDGDDPYFVVAADKGTATFSDVANAIALEHDFWLGDAFASGGSNGYDHKAMGITAKGAWLSVQRHFLEMGVDVQRDAVRVAGVGDMSGDVFGNGMLLSKSLKLIAAFDHRHIFIDPDPDPAASWKERQRMFDLPRSSWADYDTKLISKGGGVWPRAQKTIPLSAEAQAALGLSIGEVEPTQLLSAILAAPVDLMWFGGIGTYVKAAAQNNADVGDPANDRIRIDAEWVRAKVIGEGANLGTTQAARIAFALKGGRINTDFIDNSAGVDCSDNEVNIKIALNSDVRAGRLKPEPRNTLLASMTDDVADLVLEDNRLQALALSVAERGGAAALPAQLRLIEQFESEGRLDRAVEGLAGNDEYQRRAQDGHGLTRPELAVILSTAKLAIQAAAEAGKLGVDPLLDDELFAAFPPAMRAAHRDAILSHQLRNEIVATKVANRLVNRMGLIHPFELAEEEGVGMADVAEAFVVAERLFDVRSLWARIDAAKIEERTRIHLYGQVAAELRAHMADLIRHGVPQRSLADCVAELAPGIALLDAASTRLLRGEGREQLDAFIGRLITVGADEKLAKSVANLAALDGAVGIVALAGRRNADPIAVTRAFTALGQATGLDWAQATAMQLTPSDPWERLLVAGLARDFQQMRLDTIGRLKGEDVEGASAKWLEQQSARVAQFRTFIDRARAMPAPSPAMLAQLAGQARTLLAR
jgi:glutamate dehydrogenase